MQREGPKTDTRPRTAVDTELSLPRSRRGEKRGEVPAWSSGSFLKTVPQETLLPALGFYELSLYLPNKLILHYHFKNFKLSGFEFLATKDTKEF